MAVSRMEILKLYKSLLREASKFHAYNYRMYGLRRVRDGFHLNQRLSDPKEIEAKFREGQDALELIKRQVTVGSLFKVDSLVIEKQRK